MCYKLADGHLALKVSENINNTMINYFFYIIHCHIFIWNTILKNKFSLQNTISHKNRKLYKV
jgi:hypothetical protein